MRLLLLIVAISVLNVVKAQNVGIGTNNPQQRLHVAGNVRVDGMAGANGIIMHNTNGDLSTLGLGTDTNQVLLSTGIWGRLNGTVPTGSLIASTDGNNTLLLQRGFKLFGFIPGVSTYINRTFNAPANSWAETFVEGVPGKYAPEQLDANDIFFWDDSVLHSFANNNFYIYNPVTDTWRFGFTNSTAFRPSAGCKMVFTGTELIVWGGNYTSATNNGFRYNPTTQVFSPIPTMGQPSARTEFGMQLVNNRLVIWGGMSTTGTILGDGASLNLATNTWSNINAAGAPTNRRLPYTVTNTVQNTMIVWGGFPTTSMAAVTMLADGASYNPASNVWTPISTVNAPVARDGATAVWSGTEMIIYGGHGPTPIERYLNTGARFNPATNTWTTISTTNAPRIASHAAIWTGSRMLISGGTNNIFDAIGTPWTSSSSNYDPVTNTWQSSGAMGVGKALHKLIMANNMILAFGGLTSTQNPITQQFSNFVGGTHGSRYFMAPTPTSSSDIATAARLYLYIKD